MGLRAWSVASAPDRLRSKPLQPPPDVEGAVAPYLVQDRIPWKRGTPSGVGGGSFSATFQTFPEPMVARKRDPRCSPRGGTRFCASAVEHGKKTGTPLAVFHGGGHRGKQGKTSIFSVFPKDARSSPQRADPLPLAGLMTALSPPGWRANGLRGLRVRWFAIGRGDRNVLRERERGGGEAAVRSRDDGEGAIATQGGGVGRGGGFPAVSRAHGRAEARPRCSPRGGTRFCMSAVETAGETTGPGAAPSASFPEIGLDIATGDGQDGEPSSGPVFPGRETKRTNGNENEIETD